MHRSLTIGGPGRNALALLSSKGPTAKCTPHQPATIAILGADTVIGRALSLLLEGSSYDTRLLDAYPTGVVDELLEGAHLLLLTPRMDEGVREAFLGAMGKSTPQVGEMPVIALSTPGEEGLPEEEGVLRVPWPCETKVLVEQIEAALLDVLAALTTSTFAEKPFYTAR